ncbi:MAG: transposase [Saprospiraceae bacterium]|nr:transposase [Saprospiraceae bacterium]
MTPSPKIRCNLQAKAEKEIYEFLKGTRWIMVRNRADLKPEEEAKLQAVLNAFSELRSTYLLKEKFVMIANQIKNRMQAERLG